MKYAPKIIPIVAILFSTQSYSANINLNLSVPSLCVAKPEYKNSNEINIHTFCNAPKGATIFAVGSTSGSSVKVMLNEKVVTINNGERYPLLTKSSAFKDQFEIFISDIDLNNDPLSLFFHVVPNS